MFETIQGPDSEILNEALPDGSVTRLFNLCPVVSFGSTPGISFLHRLVVKKILQIYFVKNHTVGVSFLKFAE